MKVFASRYWIGIIHIPTKKFVFSVYLFWVFQTYLFSFSLTHNTIFHIKAKSRIHSEGWRWIKTKISNFFLCDDEFNRNIFIHRFMFCFSLENKNNNHEKFLCNYFNNFPKKFIPKIFSKYLKIFKATQQQPHLLPGKALNLVLLNIIFEYSRLDFLW